MHQTGSKNRKPILRFRTEFLFMLMNQGKLYVALEAYQSQTIHDWCEICPKTEDRFQESNKSKSGLFPSRHTNFTTGVPAASIVCMAALRHNKKG